MGLHVQQPFSLISKQSIFVPKSFRPIGKVKMMTRHTPGKKDHHYHYHNFFLQTEAKK